MSKGQVEDLAELYMPIGRIICQEIAKQKQRLGGDFAVAQAVMSRYLPKYLVHHYILSVWK